MHAFYTVLLDKKGYPVRYVDPDTWRVEQLCGPFGDPGEASQEAQRFLAGKSCYYLDPVQFQGKARAIAQLRRAKNRK